MLSSLVLIPLLLADREVKDETINQKLNMNDLNSSSQLSLENLDLRLAKNLTGSFGSSSTFTAPTPIYEEDDDFELEIFNFRDAKLEQEKTVKIRHFRTYGKYENFTDHDKSYFREFLCYTSEGSTCLVCTASILSILLIAIDQYFAVTHPLRYHTFIDKFKSLKLLISTWFVSTIFGIMGSFVRTESNVWNFCTKKYPQSELQIIFNVIYSFTYLTLIILVPFVVICVIYGCIYCAAHRNSERMRKTNSGSSTNNLDLYVQIPLDENRFKVKVNSSDNLQVETDLPTLPKVKSAPNFANLEKTRLNSLPNITTPKVSHENSLRSNSSFINNLKTKISNASLFRYREETRAAKISILVIFMVLVCYVPYGVALTLNTNVFAVLAPNNFNSVALSLLVLANLLSPFLFAYRNRRIQRELRRLFGLLPTRIPKELRPVRDPRNWGPSCQTHLERDPEPQPEPELDPDDNRDTSNQPILSEIPQVVVTLKAETEKKSILKRVCSKGKTWGVAKRCNFIPVESCLNVECRCSFSSASTQVSSEDYSACS